MKKRFLGFICLIYVALISYIWIFDKLKFFLAPQMQIYIKLSIIPMLIMSLVLIFNNKVTYKFKISDLVLFMPVIMLICSGNGKLSLSLASNRVADNTSIKETKQEEIKKEEPKQEEKKEEVKQTIDIENIDIDITDNVYNTIAGYISFNKNSQNWDGRTIHVKGFTLTEADYLPDNYFMIGKYAVSCCVADANFASFFGKYNEKLKNHTWYEVYGILRKGVDKEGYDMMYIDVVDIKEIDGDNEEQYVYPCYAYDDASCQAVANFNLKY